MAEFNPAFDRMIRDESFIFCRPCPAHGANDFFDMTCRHVEKATNFSIRKAFCRRENSNCVHNIVAKFCQIATFAMLFVEQHNSRMSIVLFIRGPLKIVFGVVYFVAVLVVYGSSLFGFWANERLSHKFMNRDAIFVRLCRHIQVSRWAKNSPVYFFRHAFFDAIAPRQNIRASSYSPLTGNPKVGKFSLAPLFSMFKHTTPSSLVV